MSTTSNTQAAQNATNSAIRIEDIQRATLNGRAVKLFKVYRQQGDKFVFEGQFSAPSKTANKNLHAFVGSATE